jgi:hypothetical protein
MATVKELKERAGELGIPGRSTMKKAELEAVIAEAEGRNEPSPVEYDFAVELGTPTATATKEAVMVERLRRSGPRRRTVVPPEVVTRRRRRVRARARLRKSKKGF